MRDQLERIEARGSLEQNEPLHPYIKIWMGCKRFSTSMSGAPILPGPGSYLDQDAELMLAFEILEEVWDTIEKRRETIRKLTNKDNPQSPLYVPR